MRGSSEAKAAYRRRLAPLVVAAALLGLVACGKDGASVAPEAAPVFSWPVLNGPGIVNTFHLPFIEDLDHDGHLDLVGWGLHEVVVLLGDGTGRFRAGPITAPVAGVIGNSVSGWVEAVFDRNDDPFPDLLVISAGGWGVLVNRGDGSFETTFPPVLGGALYPGSYAVGVDFEGSGRRTLVTGSIISGEIRRWRDVQGELLPTLIAIHPNVISGMEAVDLDGDGRSEVIAVSGYYYPSTIFVTGSEGSLTPAGVVTYNPARDQFVDGDGDGDLDLVSNHDSGIFWFRNEGGFVFSDQIELVPASPNYFFAIGLAAGDLDGDGLADLVVGAPLRLLTRVASGGFLIRDLSVASGSPRIVDLTEDGRPDLIFFGAATQIFVQPPAGGIQIPADGLILTGAIQSITPVRLGPGQPLQFIVDVAATTPVSLHRLELVQIQGGHPVDLGMLPPPNQAWRFLGTGDFNADGNLDLAFYGNVAGVWLGDGSGTFLATNAFTFGGTLGPLGLGDLDGDLDTDVVELLNIRIDLNIGNGLLPRPGPNVYAAPYTVFDPIVIRDADHDGRNDVLVISSRGASPGLISYGLGGSPPEFSIFHGIGDHLAATDSGTWIEADVNSDGQPDWVDVRTGRWQANDGTGRSDGALRALPDGLRGLDAQAGDLDGDGHANDLLVLAPGGFEAWIQLAPGVYAQPDPKPARGGPASLRVLLVPDQDGDGFDDLLAWSEHTLFFLPNARTAVIPH